ncbi:MAG: adenosylhomocysteinase [Nitrososphaeria archaeon]|nr:adenosylhomocysteinase [Nitrososphaeria archaeon]
MVLEHAIRDPSLAPEGRKKLEWAWARMPVLKRLREKFLEKRPLSGKKVGVCLHLEAKTALLAITLQELGAEVSITSSNPLTTQDDVAAALAERVSHVYSWYNETLEEYEMNVLRVAENRPDMIVDDGGDLGVLLHKKGLAENVLGGTEETTTGVLRYKAMENDGVLKFPVIAVNNAKSKRIFDNKYGSGQSVVDGIMRTTNMLIAGKYAVVVGYGWVGKGIASRLRGLGAKVIVCEVDPFSALEAHLDGFEVMKMADAASIGDLFVTATGNIKPITVEHFCKMKDGAILANAGHFDVEVDVKGLKSIAKEKRTVRKNIDEYILPDGRRLYLLAEGRLVNIAAGDGHPIEIMDLSFATQLLSILYLLENGEKMENKVYEVPQEIDKTIVLQKLESENIKIDVLTEEQKAYLRQWSI